MASTSASSSRRRRALPKRAARPKGKYSGVGPRKATQIDRIIIDSLKAGYKASDIETMVADLAGLTPRQQAAVKNYERNLVKGTKSTPPVGRAQARLQAKQYADRLRSQRARTIARTESVAHLSDEVRRALSGQTVVWKTMKGCCDACDRLDGKTFVVGETSTLPPMHPNCRCKVKMLRKA